MLNVRALLTDHGVQRGEMFADTAYVFDDNTRFELRKVRATFNTTHRREGRRDERAIAAGTTCAQQMLEGFGNVVIVTNDGRRLTSPHIKYMQAAERSLERHDLHARRAGPQRCAGIGFKADPQLTRMSDPPKARRAGQLHPAGPVRAARPRVVGAARCVGAARARRRRRSAAAPSGRCQFEFDNVPTSHAHAVQAAERPVQLVHRRRRRRALSRRRISSSSPTASSRTATRAASSSSATWTTASRGSS